jgi:hypothetical protein
MGGSRSGRYGSGRPISEGQQHFDLAEYLRRPDAVIPNASCIATISNGKISAQIRRRASMGGGFGYCARGAAADAACCFLALGRSPAAAVSACATSRKLWTGSVAPCMQWARSQSKSIQRRRWICRTSHRACIGAGIIVWQSALSTKIMFGPWRQCEGSVL